MKNKKNIYDNSNLAESYSGVTSPLTFSFAQYVYKNVYKHFSVMMGVNKKNILENDDIFSNMLEYIGCHMYYNLRNWFTVVSFLPGYRFNKSFFEKMLGVEKESKEDGEIAPTSWWKHYFLYFPRTIFQSLKILVHFIFMGLSVHMFIKRFNRIYNRQKSIDLSKKNADFLIKHFQKTSDRLMDMWRIPIANDFAVMVSTGVTNSLFKKWLKGSNFYDYINVASNKTLVSLDPGLELKRIGISIRSDNLLKKLFYSHDNPDDILNSFHKEFNSHKLVISFFEYLESYGSRIPNELKLESETLNEDPRILIKIIRQLVINPKEEIENTIDKKNGSIFSIELPFYRKIILSFLLRWTNNSIRRREETRFKRSVIFGYTRCIFLEIGECFEKDGLINNKKDIFFLYIDEIIDIIKNSIAKDKITPLIISRKGKSGIWKKINIPRRIETNISSLLEIEEKIIEEQKEDIKKNKNKKFILSGMIVSNPKIETLVGTAMVLSEFDPTADFEGKILVTRFTDPGWTIVFPLLKGLIVERGGMLSHAAIVARELGIPCIIGVENATNFIDNNILITMNMKDGSIIKN